ncbi:PXMP2/4 family protein 4-like [Cimex lectularius]|uniref:Mpv17-like protein n=1 Tax=Cimex lectularius TaxID=79782 RepID=A0A8I6R7A7_CIMLE|nr:PXMP2/4 family protein 4-like [Cimex lectularius]
MSAKRGAAVWRKIVNFSKRYPISRGMASYAVIWPIGSLVQQHIEGRKEYDLWRVGRFCLYGSCYVAPTLNIWMKIARFMWPQNTFSAALSKALIEQVTYTPFAMISFYFLMSLLEGKTTDQAKEEVSDKFLPTYKVGVCVWPVLQTVNYTMISEKNRVPFVSICSLAWTTFLAYMKHLEGSHFKQPIPIPSHHDKK